jgi:hypothetical protein
VRGPSGAIRLGRLTPAPAEALDLERRARVQRLGLRRDRFRHERRGGDGAGAAASRGVACGGGMPRPKTSRTIVTVPSICALDALESRDGQHVVHAPAPRGPVRLPG